MNPFDTLLTCVVDDLAGLSIPKGRCATTQRSVDDLER